MQKVYIFTASNGATIIDSTPEAETRMANMEYLEKRYQIEHQRVKRKKKTFFQKLADIINGTYELEDY